MTFCKFESIKYCQYDNTLTEKRVKLLQIVKSYL